MVARPECRAMRGSDRWHHRPWPIRWTASASCSSRTRTATAGRASRYRRGPAGKIRWPAVRCPPNVAEGIYQLPLAYLLGLEGVDLLRAFAGDYAREFAESSVAEIRRLLDSPALAGDGVTAEAVGTVAGYRAWAATYYN